MLIPVELMLEADFDGDELRALTIPGCTQNLLPELSSEVIEQAQLSAMYHYEQELLRKAAEIAERREMAGDARRERMRDDRLTGDVL
jgi:hypothetical protein